MLYIIIYIILPLKTILLDLAIISQNFLSRSCPVLKLVQKESTGDTNNCQILFFGSSPKKTAQVAKVQRS